MNEYNYIVGDTQLEQVALALYWGEGSKWRKSVILTNSDPRAIEVFVKFLREICGIDPKKLKGRLQIHDEKNVTTAVKYWTGLTGVSTNDVVVSMKPSKKSRSPNRHPNGIFSIRYNSVGLKSVINQKIDDMKNSVLNV